MFERRTRNAGRREARPEGHSQRSWHQLRVAGDVACDLPARQRCHGPPNALHCNDIPVSPTGDVDGLCSKSLRAAWRADGAYVHLVEELDGASRKRMLRRVPRRPRHFVLNAREAGGLCTPADSGELAFKQGGRAFYVFYGLGKRASGATRLAAAMLLDSLRIAPRARGP